ncbi:hypothetical protein [Alteribacillus sp. HJP-4]|uniref:hypothetical protein n=1 Tax=Alteribacillus sp. HJP-4 TaxID=2775394 RepID=UPI0035CD3B32
MSKSKELLREVKEDLELQQVNGGSCSWYDVYSETMNAMFSCHMGSLCTSDQPSGSSGGSGGSGSSGHSCASIQG